MNFSNVKEWTINEGSVIRVTDSLGRVIWEKNNSYDYSQDYFFIEDISGQPNTVSIVSNRAQSPVIEVFYSIDQTNWLSMGTTSTTAITATIPANGKLYLKATANVWGTGTNNNSITTSGIHNLCGNIMSLLYGDNFHNQTAFSNQIIFPSLFRNDITLVNAENLVLPATTLTYSCYGSMFNGCTSLTTAPTLPATTLATSCYAGMFIGCNSLTTAPSLPATTLANYCYIGMFYNCSNLSTVTIYADDISATDCLDNWLDGVSSTGDFYNLGRATYPRGVSGIPTGWTVHTS